MRQEMENSDLAERIAAFKSDPDKIRETTEFVNRLILQAQREAEIKQKERDRCKFENDDSEIGNQKTRFSRARGFMTRMFDALCNCTQTAATAARNTARNNPFTKR